MIPVTRTLLPPLEELTHLLEEAWERGWITNHGPLSRELEAKLRSYLDVEDLIFVSNGTVAIEIAIRALGIEKEIITTPFSYVATTSAAAWMGCRPILVDIDPNTLNLDPQKIEAAITPDTQAILATHVFGNPCEVEQIAEIAKKHSLKVIYDAAHCFDVKFKGRSLLEWGDCSTLSFHATKIFHTGEGGGIVASDPDVRFKARYMMNFGHDGKEAFFGVGINAKNSELHAALGICMLDRVRESIARREVLTRAYDRSLNIGENELFRPHVKSETTLNFSYYPIIFPSEEALKRVCQELAKSEVMPRRYFYPSLSTLNYVPKCHTPIADDISRRILCLPLFSQLRIEEVEMISQHVLAGLKGLKPNVTKIRKRV